MSIYKIPKVLQSVYCIKNKGQSWTRNKSGYVTQKSIVRIVLHNESCIKFFCVLHTESSKFGVRDEHHLLHELKRKPNYIYWSYPNSELFFTKILPQNNTGIFCCKFHIFQWMNLLNFYPKRKTIDEFGKN